MAASNTSSSSEKQERYRKALHAFALGQLKKERALMSPSEIEKERNEMENQRRRATKASNLSEYREIIQRSKEPPIEQHKPWEPKDIKIDLKEESELMKTMQYAIEELDISDFYSKFLRQIQTPQFLNHFSRVLGSESKFQILIYGGGFGHFSFHESIQVKLALMLLIKRDFNDRIGEIQVFDSSFTKSEVRVLEDLGFTVLRVNENSYREVSKPTLFFLPYAGTEVYDHVLRANWKPLNLNQMIILGNDLNGTKDCAVEFNEFRANQFQINGKYVRMCRYLMCIPRFSTVVPISSIDGDKISQKFLSQTRQSWHFFTWFDDDPKMKLLLKPVVVITGIFYYLFYKYRKCKRLHEGLLHGQETCSWKRDYSCFFRLGWLFRRQRIRSDKHPREMIILPEKKKKKKKKKRMMFYVSRAVVVPWLEGLPRKKWAWARKIAQGVISLMKKNEDQISYQQLDELFEDCF